MTGNTVIDALFIELARQEKPSVRLTIDKELSAAVGDDWATRPYVLITGHRRENFGEGIEQICKPICALALRYADHRFVYPVHLNPNAERNVKRLLGNVRNVSLIPPQGYQNFVGLMSHCQLILTDSGGAQEEAPSLGKPVLIMRETTERPEGVEAGTARLVGAEAQRIVQQTSRLLDDSVAYFAMADAVNPYGHGRAAARIVARIERFLGYSDWGPAEMASAVVGQHAARAT